MTTPSPPASLPAPPALNTGGFNGVLVPADVQNQIINLLVDNAAFASSITQLRTSSSTVAFPVASPEGAAWLEELQRIPQMSLNDRAEIVAVAKLAGLLDVSNETMSDSQFSLTAQFTRLLQDSLSPQLDQGLLAGSGPPEPAGVLAAAPEVTATDLLGGVLAARGGIEDAGGRPDRLGVSGAMLAAADNTRATDGQLVFSQGFAAATGLQPVIIPQLSQPIVYDSTRLYCITNRELSSVEMSTDFRFAYDATTFRVKARVACGCPDPNRAIRKLTIGDGGGDGGAEPVQPTPASASTRRRSGST